MARPLVSRLSILLAVVVAVTAAAASIGVQRIDAQSRAILEVRHPSSPSTVVVERTPPAEARGARLIAVAACSGCHGADLTGGPLNVFMTQVFTPNLTIAPKGMTDAEIDRALRAGLRPDGTSELVMPAHAYRALTDDEVAAIIARLRALPRQGIDLPKPHPGFVLRAALLTGFFRTAADKVAAAPAAQPLDVGPALESGRHLTAIACGRCHGTDLGGVDGVGPDMTIRGYYTRAQFHGLIQKGDAIGEGNMKLMIETAQANFSHFNDAEVDAIYDYLNARDLILAKRVADAKKG
jgi:cytochrome c553